LGVIPEDYDLIWEAILKIIDKAEMTEMVVEINTSGLRMPENQYYPSEEIILELIQRKVPLILGSDAHDPSDVGYAFLDTIQFLRKNGLTKTCQLNDRKKELIDLS
jgi:histidinol-phosphatase (PHP family)